MAATPSRTQEQRSAETRLAINQATIRCLVEEGFSNTTTMAVHTRAGVSRGALTHHFSSKQEMILSALKHLIAIREQELQAAAKKLPQNEDRTMAVVGLFWDSFKSDLFYASLELWTAARTDEFLLDEVRGVEQELGSDSRRLAKELFGEEITQKPNFERAIQLMFRSMRGAALTRIVRNDPEAEDKFVQDWTNAVRAATSDL